MLTSPYIHTNNKLFVWFYLFKSCSFQLRRFFFASLIQLNSKVVAICCTKMLILPVFWCGFSFRTFGYMLPTHTQPIIITICTFENVDVPWTSSFRFAWYDLSDLSFRCERYVRVNFGTMHNSNNNNRKDQLTKPVTATTIKTQNT